MTIVAKIKKTIMLNRWLNLRLLIIIETINPAKVIKINSPYNKNSNEIILEGKEEIDFSSIKKV